MNIFPESMNIFLIVGIMHFLILNIIGMLLQFEQSKKNNITFKKKHHSPKYWLKIVSLIFIIDFLFTMMNINMKINVNILLEKKRFYLLEYPIFELAIFGTILASFFVKLKKEIILIVAAILIKCIELIRLHILKPNSVGIIVKTNKLSHSKTVVHNDDKIGLIDRINEPLEVNFLENRCKDCNERKMREYVLENNNKYYGCPLCRKLYRHPQTKDIKLWYDMKQTKNKSPAWVILSKTGNTNKMLYSLPFYTEKIIYESKPSKPNQKNQKKRRKLKIS